LNNQLQRLFWVFFKEKNLFAQDRESYRRYAAHFDFNADVVVWLDSSQKCGLFVEVEFRPYGQYKDYLHFELGYKHNRTALAVLLVCLNRRHVDPTGTDPEISGVW